MFQNYRIFQKVATGVLVLFCGLMGLVTVVAYGRTSGATRQDMSEARFVRQAAGGAEKQARSQTQADEIVKAL